MVKITLAQVFVLLVSLDVAISLIPNETIADVANNINAVKTRKNNHVKSTKKNKKKTKSTSSSKSRHASSESGSDESLDLSTDGITSSDDVADEKHKYSPKSSKERKSWRKWHRKCTPCKEDQVKKWRDPTIKWICGAFQRARRSFKSPCMMYYRNCQDGTMFTKISDHRCEDNTSANNHGEHFFYDYRVVLTDDSSDTDDSDSSSVLLSQSI